MTDTQADLFPDGKEPAAPRPDATPEAAPKMSVREAIDAAVKEVNRDEKGRFAKAEEAAPPKDKPAEPSEPAAASDAGSAPSSDAAPAEHKQAPQSWSKEAKAQWDSLPASIQAEAHRREADTAKGVQQLKSKYEALDRVLAPYHVAMQQSGRTPDQVVQQLLQWNMALAQPDKAKAKQALQLLAQTFGIDVATPSGSASTASPGATSQGQLPPEVAQQITGLTSRLEAHEAALQQQNRAAAEQTVMAWARDPKDPKPHFEKVRSLMAHLIHIDLNALDKTGQTIGGYVRDGRIDLDAAYQAAILANPETRGAVLAEEQAKKAAANKAAVDKARSAAVSVKPGAPAAPAGANSKGAPKKLSVRESIMEALAQQRSR